MNPSQGYGGDWDAFVTKLNSSESTFGYSTYLGGGKAEGGRAIAVDAAGAAYVTGYTNSTNFPTPMIPIPYQPINAGGYDGFVAKLAGGPTAVTVRSFAARRSRDGVVLRWRTTGATAPLGFDVYRGPLRVNEIPIPARPTIGGSSRSYVDRAAPRGVPLRYRLAAVSLDGTRHWIAAVTVPAR